VKVAILISTARALTVTVLGTTVPRASNLQCFAIFDSSKHCVRPLYKFVYSFKVVKLFLKHPVLSLSFILTANEFPPGGSGTTIRNNTQITHHEQTKHSTKTIQTIKDKMSTMEIQLINIKLIEK
jgi:hypothetical protein